MPESSRHVMITEIGHFALVLALCVAVLQASLPLYGAARGDGALIAWARPAALAQFLFVAIAFFALMHAYAVSDFSLANVTANSNSTKPLLYKLSGVWSPLCLLVLRGGGPPLAWRARRGGGGQGRGQEWCVLIVGDRSCLPLAAALACWSVLVPPVQLRSCYVVLCSLLS